MAVTAALVSCAANDWTLVASAVSKIAGVFPRNPNAQLFIIPTSANTKPGALDLATQPAVPVTGQPNSVLNDDGTTFWWIWNPGTAAVPVVIWNL